MSSLKEEKESLIKKCKDLEKKNQNMREKIKTSINENELFSNDVEN